MGLISYFEICIFFVNFFFLWEKYLEYRQFKLYSLKQVPLALSEILSAEEFTNTQTYNHEKSIYFFITDSINIIVTNCVLLLYILPYAWEIIPIENEILHSLVFFYITGFIQFIYNIPFEYYYDFVLEKKYGFTKQYTFKLFIKDKILELLISSVIASAIIPIIILIINYFGSLFYIYVWLFIFSFQFLFIIFLYPIVIQPLFNKLSLLPEDSILFKKIKELVNHKDVQFAPLSKIFVIDGSKRSTKSNAYLYGFWRYKKIVLYDTLLPQEIVEAIKNDEKNDNTETSNNDAEEKENIDVQSNISRLTTDEVLGVLAHELGHWKYWHVFGFLIVSALTSLFTFWLFGRFVNDSNLYSSFGFNTETALQKPVFIGLLLFMYSIFTPISYFLGFFVNFLSCYFENFADSFAVKLGYAADIRNALIKLGFKNNKGTILTDDLYTLFHNDHPPLLKRIQYFDEQLDKKTQ